MRKKLRLAVIILFSIAILYSINCKSSTAPEIIYDITGTWTLTITAGNETDSAQVTFTGTVNNGNVMLTGIDEENEFFAISGTYTASNENVNFKFPIEDDDGNDAEAVFWGKFDSEDKMSGQFNSPDIQLGIWTASR